MSNVEKIPGLMRPLRILLVEDNEDHARIVFRCFATEYRENRIDHVLNGIEALAYLRREGRYSERRRPDLILLDLKMPMMDGHETLKHLKADPDLRTIPVIVLTTSDAHSDVQRAFELHTNSYVTKPIEPGQMRSMADSIREFWGVWTRTAHPAGGSPGYLS